MNQNFMQRQTDIIKEDIFSVKKWMDPNPPFIRPGTSFEQVAHQFQKKDVDCMPVVSKTMEPVGIVTEKKILRHFANGGEGQRPLLEDDFNRNFQTLKFDDSIDKMNNTLERSVYPVVNKQDRLVGMLTRKEVIKSLFTYIHEMGYMDHTAAILNEILDTAYEGITVVDEEGKIVEMNDAYCRFIGIKREDAIGRNVQDVIDNTNLHNTIRTGMPERGALQYIQGQEMIVHRIPIWKDNQVVGAIGMLIFEGVSELVKIYKRLQDRQNHLEKNQYIFTESGNKQNFFTLDQIIGDSESTAKLKQITRKVAKTNATILITGESGSGKEMYAQSIHSLSPFVNGKFISVNCGAIPEQLFESELFGYEEGAFTGAKKGGKLGKFELAQNGTIFLDEIGEMPLLMQTKLLRVLQEKEFERVGGTKKVKMNSRIIAATNQNLIKMMDEGKFREDLYYRINVIELSIPALCERKKDIPSLVSHYLHVICNRYQRSMKQLTPEAMSTLMNYDWRGNIRELVNLIERLVILVDDKIIERKHLPEYMKESEQVSTAKFDPSSDYTNLLQYTRNIGQDKEREMIRYVLQKNNGNKTKAAKELGIHRTTLYEKLKKYNISI